MNLTKHLAGLLAAVASCAACGAPLLSEGFNDIGTLPGSGWVLSNQSTPPGSTGWFQGVPGFFPAAAGPADSYIAANFNNAAFGGAVSNWLFTPQLSLFNGESLNFSLRLLGEGALDTVEVYFSSSGASADPGDFALLASYSSDVDTGWTGRSVILNGLAAPASGRFAFRYVVDDTSVDGNYVGIDSVSVNPFAIPEPGTLALVLVGAVALLRTRRRRRPVRAVSPAGRWLACAGLSLCGAAAQAAPLGDNGVMRFPHVAVTAQEAPLRPQPSVPPGGFMAYKDPVTGKLGNPTAEQAAALGATMRGAAPIARQRAAQPQIIRPPHGGLGVMLDDSHARYAVARKAADGTVSETCEPHEHAVTGEQK
jgi:hypothetical protein